ncbi:MAG: FAD:protein FMN transferase [Buchnera aphidicola (Diuraphis noxia)]|nr:FAD:protein FMN transferase [Buchnera aphidicola]
MASKNPKSKKKIQIYNLIKKSLDKDEKMLSSWKENSIVSQFNKRKKNELQIINRNFYHIISQAMKINKKTNGKLDITVGKLINIWGFGTREKPTIYPSMKKIQNNMFDFGSRHLKIIKKNSKIYLTKDINGIEINLSTLGEGFATDHISYILKKKR